MITRENNFDLIRLLAAFQVLVVHGIEHLKLSQLNPVMNITEFFPGVLMFFTISGFLIFASLDRNNNLKKYFYNRFLRIYPALWLCFILTVILLVSFSIVPVKDLFGTTMLKWNFAQITFFQFWTPDILRLWGVGTPNGSLWTIPVEIEYYLLLPAVIMFFKGIQLIYKFLFLGACSVLFNAYLATMVGKDESVFVKLARVNVLPYLYCFLIGAIIYLYWDKIKKIVEGKAIIWFIIFISFCLIASTHPSYYPKNIQMISNFLLAILTISLAYTLPTAGRILKGNDISYGMYIYHMLVINSLVALGYTGETKYLLFAVGLTTILSLISWLFVEKKALALKTQIK